MASINQGNRTRRILVLGAGRDQCFMFLLQFAGDLVEDALVPALNLVDAGDFSLGGAEGEIAFHPLNLGKAGADDGCGSLAELTADGLLLGGEAQGFVAARFGCAELERDLIEGSLEVGLRGGLRGDGELDDRARASSAACETDGAAEGQ